MVPQESSRKISEQAGRVTQERESPEGHARLMTRRRFLRHAGLTAAAMALLQAPQVLSGRGWIQPVYAAKPDLVHDTFNGLLAFVVPGSDTYSKHQGVSTAEPGGVDAGITDVLIASMDQAVPFRPNFSVQLAGILNGVARRSTLGKRDVLRSIRQIVVPEKGEGLRVSRRRRLRNCALRPLAGVLPQFVAFLVYSEAGVFDPVTAHADRHPARLDALELRGGRGRPRRVQGYYQDRRKVT